MAGHLTRAQISETSLVPLDPPYLWLGLVIGKLGFSHQTQPNIVLRPGTRFGATRSKGALDRLKAKARGRLFADLHPNVRATKKSVMPG